MFGNLYLLDSSLINKLKTLFRDLLEKKYGNLLSMKSHWEINIC
jgi:hypothetical protein